MTPLYLLVLQAAAPDPAPVDVRRIDFDLGRYRPGTGCGPADPQAITVCGRRPPATYYPLDRMAPLFEAGPMDAETSLSGPVRGGVYVRQVEFPNGQQSKRILVGVKLPF